MNIRTLTAIICCCLFVGVAHAQEPRKHAHRKGAMYFSWGYNGEWYSRSTVHIKQESIGDVYNMVQVNAHDHKGWDEGIFNMQLSIPQYNWRIGYFFNDDKDLGVELNFDHTKYIITEGQYVRFKGTHNGTPIDQDLLFSQPMGFFWYLNNGANFLLFNLTKRQAIYHTDDNYFGVDLLGKIGVGPVVPHVQNSLFGHPNMQHFQLGGWNAGLETAVRVSLLRYAYLEFAQKVDYASYIGLKIYNGTARQAFGTYELILSAGFAFPFHKHNHMFMPKEKSEE